MAKRTASARKQARAGERRAVRNRSVRSAVKTRVSRVRRAAGEGAEDLEQLAATAVASLDRAVAKNVLHRNNAARRKSRLMKAVAAATGESEAPAEESKPAKKPAATKAATSKAKASPKSPRRPAQRRAARS